MHFNYWGNKNYITHNVHLHLQENQVPQYLQIT